LPAPTDLPSEGGTSIHTVNNIPKKKEIVKIKDFTPKFHTLTELAERSGKEINKFFL